MSESEHRSAERRRRIKPDSPGGRAKGVTPVPSFLALLCPNCDYSLTGLAVQRCPRCGQTVTPAAARAHAFRLSDAGKRAKRRERQQRLQAQRERGTWRALRYVALVIGIVMTILGFVSPVVLEKMAMRARHWEGGLFLDPDTKLLFRTLSVVALMLPVDAVIAIAGARKGWSWTLILLTTGVLTCIVGILIGRS